MRGMHVMDGMLYAVCGGFLYSVTDNYATQLGAISGSGSVSMSDNGTQLCIVNDGGGWLYNPTYGFYDLTVFDTDFEGASTVTYLDGYFIFSRPDSGQFFISALYDGGDIDALDFATAESSPDNIVACIVDHRELWLLGQTTFEVWQNTGNADFPFERIPGAIGEKGCISKDSVARLDNSLFWLDQDGIVRRAAGGYVPTRISTHAVEHAISQGDLSTATAFAYAQEGHEFYVLSVPDAGTFVYDSATQLWHKRESYGKGRWRGEHHAYMNGVHYVGDFETGNVYTLSLDTYTDNGETIIAEMTFPVIHNEGYRFRLHQFQVDMETADSSAQVMLQTSKDGKTWGNEHWVDFGAVDGYLKRAVWRRMGQFWNCHVRVRISDPARRAVYSAFVEVTPDG